MMNIRKADHVSLLVANTERSLQFYTQVLGMQEIPRPKNFDFPGAWLTKANFQIHLIGEEVEGRAKQVNPGYHADELALGRGTHVAFEVDDLEAAIQHLREQGVEIVGGPRPRGDGVQQMYICDPDGYIVELFVWES
jgi:catechol 2,3-dioxygenase-like lactoylglutathione lyase family enzyme